MHYILVLKNFFFFQVLLPSGNRTPTLMQIDAFLSVHVRREDYQIGKTMVFLRDQACRTLRRRLHEVVVKRVVLMQACVRRYLARKKYLITLEAIVMIQSFWRMVETQREIEEWHVAATIIQVGGIE